MYHWIKKFKCPNCKFEKLFPYKKNNKYKIWGYEYLFCSKCKYKYPISSRYGILNMILESKKIKKYDYWNDLYDSSKEVISLLIKRFSNNEKFLLNYYVMANLCKKLKWHVKDSVELGCGWGTNSVALYKFGISKEIWLVDISESALSGAIKVAEAFGIKPYAIRADIHNLPFRDNSFELSLSGGLFEHFIGQEQEDLIKENCRISKKILCQVPENNIIYKLFRFFYTIYNSGKWPFGFEVAVNKKEFMSIFEKFSFRIVDFNYSNILTSIITKLAEKNIFFKKLSFKPFFFKFDIVIAAEKLNKFKFVNKHGIKMSTMQ